MNGSDEDIIQMQIEARNVEPVIGPLPDNTESAANKPMK